MDWKAVWKDNESSLKQFAVKVSADTTRYRNHGQYDFPSNFEYPFDEGFVVERRKNDVTLAFYTDRGLLDHYSAFIYTTDSTMRSELDEKVKMGGNDHFLEKNWYLIND